MYIHQQPDWPNLHWNNQALTPLLAEVRHRQGRLLGQMKSLGFELQKEAVLQALTEDVVKSSEIEGEKLEVSIVRSSIARKLGIDAAGLTTAADRHVEGVVEMLLDATQRHTERLTKERLFGWNATLFPTGRSGMRPIRAGAWRDDRDGPMQVVSGPVGHEHVHFQAPPAARVDQEMTLFLDWLNEGPEIDAVLKSGAVHFGFVTIHPFDDGNGRIARAIADMCLARSENSSQRFYSMSSQIRQERSAYYQILEDSQKGEPDISLWQSWFLGCLGRAIDAAETLLQAVLAKSRFWQKFGQSPLNDRHRVVLNKLLDGFEGKLTTSKWAKLTGSSQDTAYRDILDLVQMGILVRGAEGGRSTSYLLASY
jgi:Fic family protein